MGVSLQHAGLLSCLIVIELDRRSGRRYCKDGAAVARIHGANGEGHALGEAALVIPSLDPIKILRQRYPNILSSGRHRRLGPTNGKDTKHAPENEGDTHLQNCQGDPPEHRTVFVNVPCHKKRTEKLH